MHIFATSILMRMSHHKREFLVGRGIPCGLSWWQCTPQDIILDSFKVDDS